MKTVALRQIGNSQGIILEKTILELVHADEKNAVFDVQVEGNKIVLRPLSRAEQKAMILKAAQDVTDEQAPVLKKLAK
jgi:antitoxin component of MazEF toxin-antitoxin module